MNSIISENTASSSSGYSTIDGGVYNSGTLTVANSTISGNAAEGALAGTYEYRAIGGRIYNDGSLILVNSIILGNTAVLYPSKISPASALGGGIQNSGTLTITNCTISGNSTRNAGGGIYMTGTTASLIINKSTVVHNTHFGVASDIYCDSGTITGMGTSTTIGSLTANTTYEFQVRVVNADGKSEWSQTLTISTDAHPTIESANFRSTEQSMNSRAYWH